MGGLKEWASQAAGTPPSGYEVHVMNAWASLAFNIDPASVTTWSNVDNFFGNDESGTGDLVSGNFNMMDLLYAAGSEVGGSPYENMTAYDPDTLLADVTVAIQEFQDAVRNYDAAEVVREAVTQARANIDSLIPEENISAAVTAYQERTKIEYQKAVTDTLTGLWTAGAILSTQTIGKLALLGRARLLADREYDAKLRFQWRNEQLTAQAQLVQAAVQASGAKLDANRAFVAMSLDRAKIHVTAKQDQKEKDLEYLIKHITWDMNILQEYGFSSIGALYGAQVVNRSQTKGERLMSLITGSASAGIQGGMAMGSAEAGIGLGALQAIGGALLL